VAGTLLAAKSASAVGLADAPAVNYDQIGYHNGRVNLVRLSAIAAPMQLVDTSSHATMSQLSGLQSSWLVRPLATRGASLCDEMALWPNLGTLRVAIHSSRVRDVELKSGAMSTDIATERSKR
jgi:hypothetical protein